MPELKFDKDKVLNVPIEKVVPNSWNPKDEDTKEYLKILDSVKLKGLRGTIVVREHPYTKGFYEIIDGQQRYTAAKELKYKTINVYNEGIVSDQEAQELTIWYQQQVPFNRITEAYLVTQMVTDFGIEAIELPYTPAEIDEFKELANFNFDLYKPEPFQDNDDGTVTFTVKLTKAQHETVKTALDKYVEENKSSTAEALVALIGEQ
jgi:hypothetical protein